MLKPWLFFTPFRLFLAKSWAFVRLHESVKTRCFLSDAFACQTLFSRWCCLFQCQFPANSVAVPWSLAYLSQQHAPRLSLWGKRRREKKTFSVAGNHAGKHCFFPSLFFIKLLFQWCEHLGRRISLVSAMLDGVR